MRFLPRARTSNVVIQILNDETLIYDLNSDQAFCLNEVCSRVFSYCDGKTSAEFLQEKYSYSEELIFLTLDELNKHNLLEELSAYNFPFNGITRREAIRRVGLTTMVALPVISSVLAPSSVQAGSTLRLLGQSCTTSSQCASTAPNCTARNTPPTTRRCCSGSISYYDSGEVVNSCSGGACNSATFACQSDADGFCCSNSATASCTGNSCACRCD